MKDIHAAELALTAGQPPLPAQDRDDRSKMNHQGFKRFRRKVSQGETGDLLSDLETSRNLPARIGDEWPFLRMVSPGVRSRKMARAPLVNLHRDDPAAAAFDLLRTRLLQALRDNGWTRIGVTAPTGGCGATFTAVNLALSMARIQGSRTVLMDMNLRAPGIGAALDMRGAGNMRSFLCGAAPVRDAFLRVSETLALGLTQQPENNAAELLHDARTTAALQRMINQLRPGVVLYDLPPVLAHDDVSAFLPQVDGILLVADGTATTAAHIAACERVLDGHTRLLGVVLNRARQSSYDPADA